MFTIKTLRESHPENDALVLLSGVIKKNSAFLAAHPEYRLSVLEYIRFRRGIHRRRRGWSVAVILGHKEFCGLDFLVNRHTLVPRPETELLVETAKTFLTGQTVLIDVGTGSGCIPLAILTGSVKPRQALATDRSRPALRVAKKNASRLRKNIQFFPGNLLDPILKKTLPPGPILVTANLPYLTEEQFAQESTIRREPKKALVAAEDGLALYARLLRQLKKILIDRMATVIMEIDPAQKERMLALVTGAFPKDRVEVKKDLAVRDRVVILSVTSSP